MIVSSMRSSEPETSAPQVQPVGDSRFIVTNLTRNTILADRLEKADTAAKRNKGLLGRSGLDAGEGLWIVPCESVHTFFMQFPLDLVYLDRNHRILKVRAGVRPWRLSACLVAHSIVELPAGVIAASQSQRGDQLELSPVDRGQGRN
jgi:uncharacterized protein